MTDGERVELDVFLEIQVLVEIFDARVIGDVACLARRILGKQSRGRSADELRASRQHVGPEPGVESRIVYDADECREPLRLAHSRIQSSSAPTSRLLPRSRLCNHGWPRPN